MRWTIHLEGGPKRVNHAACVVGDKIYSFGGYCSGEIRSRTATIDVHVLDTSIRLFDFKQPFFVLDTYRWTRVFGEQSHKKMKNNNHSPGLTEDSFTSGFDSDEGEADMEFEIADEMMEEEDEVDQQLAWQYNPLAAPEMNTDSGAEEDGFKNVPYQRYGHTVVAYNDQAYLWGGRNDEFGASSRLFEYSPSMLLVVTLETYHPPISHGLFSFVR